MNRRMIHEVRDLPGVTFHDLYEAYPDFDVDRRHEQELLSRHDLVVMQHPLYWYTVPPLVNQWKIAVLTHGWAYGAGGSALRGKSWLSAITTGGSDAAYQHGGLHRYTIRELLESARDAAVEMGMTGLAERIGAAGDSRPGMA